MGEDILDYRADSWEQYKDKRHEYRWRRRDAGRAIVGAACEGYVTLQDCIANAERHGMNGNPNSIGGDDHWDFYMDSNSGFRWRRKTSCGEIIGASSRSYQTRAECEANASRNGMASKPCDI